MIRSKIKANNNITEEDLLLAQKGDSKSILKILESRQKLILNIFTLFDSDTIEFEDCLSQAKLAILKTIRSIYKKVAHFSRLYLSFIR